MVSSTSLTISGSSADVDSSNSITFGSNVSVLHVLRDIYDRGVADGVFRPGLDVVDIHMTIFALSFFNVSNRATFSLIFKRNMSSRTALAKRRDVVADTVISFVRKA